MLWAFHFNQGQKINAASKLKNAIHITSFLHERWQWNSFLFRFFFKSKQKKCERTARQHLKTQLDLFRVAFLNGGMPNKKTD